jgi:CheY-specific phosphatase CheX
MVFHSDFLNDNPQEAQANSLLNYLQHQSPEVLARVAKSVTPEIKQIISQNVQGLVGMLPSENFNVQITTDRDNLAGLLASAMMTGYFLRQMEQRMQLDESLSGSVALPSDTASDKSTDSSP